MAPRKASVKAETAQAVEAVKAADTAAVKAEPAAEEKKAAKALARKTAAKKAEPAAEKKPAEEKKPAAKTTTRKTAAKKAEPAADVVIEFGGKQIVAKEILESAKKDFAAKHEGEELKSIHLYIKPEESVAYYVANDGIGDPEDKVEF